MKLSVCSFFFLLNILSLHSFPCVKLSSRRNSFRKGESHTVTRIITLPESSFNMISPAIIPADALEALCVNSLGFTAFILTGKADKMLTRAGCLHSYILGNLLWYGLGWKAWSTCTLYLLAGSFVTKVKMSEKIAKGVAEKRNGRRGPENVWGSAFTAATCAILSKIYPSKSFVLSVGFVSSLATKLGDTFASEIGKAYGRSTYLITTMKKVAPGTEGAVSIEGLIAGTIGSLVISLYAVSVKMVPLRYLWIYTLSAFIANNIESILGATSQGQMKWLTNEMINFINTALGALIAILLLKFG